MGFYENGMFFLLLIPFMVIAILLGILEKPLRNYTTAVSIVFVLAILGQHPEQLGFFLGYLVYQWGLLRIYIRLRKKERHEKQYYAAVALSLVPLVLSKLNPFMPVSLFCFIGISYITFKVLQIIIECYDGVIKEINTLELLSFLLFFPSFSSGPIDRSRRYADDYHRVYAREEYLQLASSGIFRLLIGYIYKFILSALIFKVLQLVSGYSGLLNEIEYAYLYGLYLFFDFAGYSLMAVGTAYVFGIRLPDNFNKPFLSIDMKDFWDRWHISLSYWLRDYLFTRLVMKFKKKKWLSSRLQRANACYIINMSVMGLWHGISISYIVYGLYHGLLLALTETWQKKSGFYKKHKGENWYKGLSWVITMQLYMFGFYIFSGRLFG